MRSPSFASAPLVALALALSLAASGPASASECKGVNSAHCRCQLRFPSASDGGNANATNGWLRPTGLDGKEIMTYTIPNQCFNQQKDAIEYRINKGCWAACRNAYGVDGATPDPEMKKTIANASKKLRGLGFCGGWINAPSFFAAGTNKYRANTNVGIGMGVGGTVATAPDGKKYCK